MRHSQEPTRRQRQPTTCEAVPATIPDDAGHLDPPEPRWQALLAVLVAGGLNLALAESLATGPRWLLLAIIVALEVPVLVAHRRGYVTVNKVLGHVASAVITLFMLLSLCALIRTLPSHGEPPVVLLRSAGVLWVTNVLVFASWYWRLDAGGPHGRDLRVGHPTGDFLFPQMTLPDGGRDEAGRAWSPQFVDYLFLAFNTSTAFSPTDVPVLSRWAKVMVMTQSALSLTIVVILVGRGVNIL